MTPPIDPLIVTAADALKSVQALAAQVASLQQELGPTREQCANQADIISRAYQALGVPAIEDLAEHITHLRQDKTYAEEHLTHLAEFIGRKGMTWVHVVSEAVSLIEQLRRENETLARQVPPEPCADRPTIATFTLHRVENNASDPLSPPPGFSALELRMHCRGSGLNVRTPYFTAQLINPVSSLRNGLLHAGHALVAHLGWDPEPLEEFITPPKPPADEPGIPFSDLKPEDLRVPITGSLSITEPGAFRKHLGQQWCLTIDLNLLPSDDIRIVVGPGMWAVLCNVYSDLNSGGLTYEPVPINDLPKIP